MISLTVREILEALESVEIKNDPFGNVDIFPLESIGEILGMYYLFDPNEKWDEPATWVFVEKYFYSWICTDTKVGYSVIYMHGEPVALTKQLGRKCEKEIFWIGGIETFQKVYAECVKYLDYHQIDLAIGPNYLVDIDDDYWGGKFHIEIKDDTK